MIFDLAVSQVKLVYISKNKRLKQYRNFVWDVIDGFDIFGIVWMERSNNKIADLLENISINLVDITFFGITKVDVQIRPSIPDNI